MMRKGITLMELLVVISILATLAALLYPVYLNLHSRMYVLGCVDQLRQIGLAIHMYVQDWGGDTPYNMPYGIEKLYPLYISEKELLFCPRVKAIISKEELFKLRTSYFDLHPKPLDISAKRHFGEIGFSDVFAARGDQTPIVYCEAHRYLPLGSGIETVCREMGTIEACWNAFLSPDGPIIVLRWGGKVDLVYKGGILVSTLAVLIDY